MNKMLAGLLIVLLLVMGGLHLMAYSMDTADDKIVKAFAKKGITVDVEYVTISDRVVRVIATAPRASDSTLIVFVHGAPGSWDAFEKYMVDSAFLASGRLVAYDRPGYGRSGKKSMTDITEQSDVLKQIIDRYRLPHVVVVGHSYGGPIVGNIAARYPEIIDRAVMIAPVNDPLNEPIFWFMHFSHWRATKWLLPNPFQVAGDEKFSHASELAQMQDLWASIKVPILHIHGAKDGLAPSAPNIAWSKNEIPAEVLTLEVLEGEGHLVLWQAFYKVSGLILRFIE